MKKITNNIHHIGMVALLAVTPLIASAQAAESIGSLIGFLVNIFQNWLLPMMVSLALIYTIWAVIEYIQANEDSQKKTEKRQQMFWGIIGLFVIISVWSLVAIVQNTFNIFGGGVLRPGG